MVQADLLKKRELTKRLQSRLQELRLQSEQWEAESESEDDSSEDQNRSQYAPAVRANSGLDVEPTPVQEAASNLTSTLRARNTSQVAPSTSGTGSANKATATGTSTSGSHQAFPSAKPAEASVAERESLLTAHRTEQSALTDSLLSLARELKLSVNDFQSGIEMGKDALERAASGLDKNIAGMDSTGKRMGVLRRMTEGRGWLGRLQLYGMIAALWIVALMIMTFMPKLRLSPGF